MTRWERGLNVKKELTARDIERCRMLELSEPDIARIIPAGLDPDNSVHWHALHVAILYGKLDELFGNPVEFLRYGVYKARKDNEQVSSVGW